MMVLTSNSSLGLPVDINNGQQIDWDNFAATVDLSDLDGIDWTNVDFDKLSEELQALDQQSISDHISTISDVNAAVTSDFDFLNIQRVTQERHEKQESLQVSQESDNLDESVTGQEGPDFHGGEHKSRYTSASSVHHGPPELNTRPLSYFGNADILSSLVPKMAPIDGFAFDLAYLKHPLIEPTNPNTDTLRGNSAYKKGNAYEPPPTLPRPWSCFRYTTKGELDPRQLYTSDEITRYLFEHPVHHKNNPLTSGLRLRIQRSPPQSNHRYPTLHSHRCRFLECPAPSNVISIGQTQVAFDELSATNPFQDPFITAGYCHLWCLERYCDFLRIVCELNLGAEDRFCLQEKHEYAPQRLIYTQDKRKKDIATGTPLEVAVREFILQCRLGLLQDYPSHSAGDSFSEGTLNHRLALVKLENERASERRQRLRRQENAGYMGSTLPNHLGDLVAETQMRIQTRIHSNQTPSANVIDWQQAFQQGPEVAAAIEGQRNVNGQLNHGALSDLRDALNDEVKCSKKWPASANPSSALPTSPETFPLNPRSGYRAIQPKLLTQQPSPSFNTEKAICSSINGSENGGSYNNSSADSAAVISTPPKHTLIEHESFSETEIRNMERKAIGQRIHTLGRQLRKAKEDWKALSNSGGEEKRAKQRQMKALRAEQTALKKTLIEQSYEKYLRDGKGEAP